MSRTIVVNVRRDKYDVYIGRGSKWGNPFPMKSECDRAYVIDLYEDYARDRFTKEDLRPLVGMRLGCYCRPKICHGDVLIKMMQEFGLEEPDGQCDIPQWPSEWEDDYS